METAATTRPLTDQPSKLESAATFLPTPKQFFVLLGVYFGLHLITRALVSESVGIDEADQLVLGQKLSWGYGPQAPLYTWLMIFFLKTFGYSVFSLTQLRELMLFGIYALTYLNGRKLMGSHLCGLVAAAALQFHPSIVWESQRELTHSILASLMILATMLAFQHVRKDRLFPWIMMGLFGGLATLSKYNAALVYAALLISAFSIPAWRARVFDWRLALAVGVSLVIMIPTGIWALNHRAQASGSMYKLGIQENVPWAVAAMAGLVEWLQTASAHLLGVTVVFAIVFWRPLFFQRVWKNATDETKWLWRIFVLLNLMAVASILFLRVTALKDRWLQPIFIWVPLLLVGALRQALTPTRIRLLLGLSATVSVIVVMAASGRLFFTEWRGRRDVLNAPFRQFGNALRIPAQKADAIVAGGYWLAGNAVLWVPEKPIYSVDIAPPPDSMQAKRCLLIWDASRRPELPGSLLAFARHFTGGESLAAPTFVERKWRYHHSKTMRLGMIELEKNSRPAPDGS